ncbi:MAG: hypothetical protein OEQ47_18595 [Acidimicrobiia bacterium]|nr:hypothetical protein [Acidimicrobiia bacterium]
MRDERSWADEAIEAARAGAKALLGEDALRGRGDGIRSAFDATRRFGELFAPGGEGALTGDERYRQFRADTERMFDAWIDVARAAFDASMDAIDRVYRAQPSAHAVDDAVHFAPIVAGESTTSTLWLRNPSESPLVGVQLSCSALVSELGDVITTDGVEIDPSTVDIVDAHSAMPVSVRLRTRPETAAGTYRGRITTDVMGPAEVVAEIVAAR